MADIPFFFDYRADLERELGARLRALGVEVDKPLKKAAADHQSRYSGTFDRARWMCMQWYNIARRRIPPARRSVLRSRELAARVLRPHVDLALQGVEADSRNGDDLNPRLGRKWRDVDEHDHLLNEWGIHHLHLWPTGGRELLYVVTFPDALLFVDLRDHKAFADIELIEIVKRNWPQVIERFKMPGILPGQNPSAKELAEARHRGLTVPFSIDGEMYMPIGFGQSTTGMSAMAVDLGDRLHETARSWCEQLGAQAAELLDVLNRRTSKNLSELQFELRFDAMKMYAVEKQTDALITGCEMDL